MSLRAKITGVIVALLVFGLFAAGVGTLAFVRTALITAQDEQLTARARSNFGAGLLDVNVDADLTVHISLTEAAAAAGFYVAVYNAEGELIDSVPETGGPVWPESFPLATTIIQDSAPFTLHSADRTTFHASAGILPLGVGPYFTQVIALPLAPIERTVATFFGAYTLLALLTILAGALSTRYLVTRTFRPLENVERTATEIAAGDFRQRLSPGDARTEVGKLTGAINAMLDRVDDAISERDASVRQMRRFIGDASHELRTPLVTVRGYAELYRLGAIRGDEDTRQAMERIEKEAMRMGVMVEDLLALARLDERSEVQLTPVDLRPVAHDAAMDLRASSPGRTVSVIDLTAAPPSSAASAPAAVDDSATAPPRRRGGQGAGAAFAGATLSLLRRLPRPVPASRATTTDAVDAPPLAPIALTTPASGPALTLPPVVRGEENRVRQVVANLLGNAQRFSPENSPIEIAVGTDRTDTTETAPLGWGWISIVDHGEGVPEQIRSNIFERFWRADTSRTRETGGSGLGLAIVSSIVEALRGRVAVDETPGGGATFTVWLPLAKEATLYLDTQPLPKLRPEEL